MESNPKYKFVTDIKSQLRSFLSNTKTDWNYITPVEFYNDYWTQSRSDYVLVDLREKSAYDKFHIDKSINIYWLNILDDENLQLLPKDKKIFLICYVGHTSSQAMVLLKLLGYDAVGIKFGMGISPKFGVPVAGWVNYNFPLIECANNSGFR